MKTCRLFFAVLPCLVYTVLLGVIFSDDSQHDVQFLSSLHMLRFGFSMFVAFLFLSVGVLVWLFAYKRYIASFVLGLCTAIMVIFEVESAALLNERLFSTIANESSTFAICLLSVLLVFFPKNYFSLETPILSGKLASHISFLHKNILLKWYLTLNIFTGILVGTLVSVTAPNEGIHTIQGYYYAFCFFCSFLFLFSSPHSVKTRHERQKEQQWRLVVVGIGAAVAPLLFLTLLPNLLHLPTYYQVDSQISTITLIFLPISLGYGLLRYQFLVPDVYIRGVTAGILGILGLLVVSDGILIGDLLVFPLQTTWFWGVLCILLPIVCPLAWFGALRVAQWSFLSEFPHQQASSTQLHERVQKKAVSQGEIATFLTTTLGSLFGTFEVCLFVLSPEHGLYRLTPRISYSGEMFEMARHRLLQTLWKCDIVRPLLGQDIERTHGLITYLSLHKSPVFLHEFLTPRRSRTPVHTRSILTSKTVAQSPLLVPMFLHNELLAIVAIGTLEERGHTLTGPDFWDLPWFLAKYAEPLYLLIRQEQERYESMLLERVHGFTRSEVTTSEHIVHAAAQLCDRAELWRYDMTQHPFLDASAGNGPVLAAFDTQNALSTTMHGRPYFFEARGPAEKRPDSFACLPLQDLGLLVLTYSSPHRFSSKEKELLQVFSVHCASEMALHQARTALSSLTSQPPLSLFQITYWNAIERELQEPLRALHDSLLLIKSGRLPVERVEQLLQNTHKTLHLLLILEGSCKELMNRHIPSSPPSTSVGVEPTLLFSASLFEEMFRYEHRTIVSLLSPDVGSIMGEEDTLRQLFVHVFRLACARSPMESSLTITSTHHEEDVFLSFAVSLVSNDACAKREVSSREEENQAFLFSLVTHFAHLLQGTVELEPASDYRPFALVLVLKRGPQSRSSQALIRLDSNGFH